EAADVAVHAPGAVEGDAPLAADDGAQVVHAGAVAKGVGGVSPSGDGGQLGFVSEKEQAVAQGGKGCGVEGGNLPGFVKADNALSFLVCGCLVDGGGED